MASNERNALAELADQLDKVGVELCCDELDNESKTAVRKAKLIIAELANVRWCRRIKVPDCYDSARAVAKCSTIAEEGAKE